jgi:hypothetical protein
MAIHDALPGGSVTITVAGEVLKEHRDPYEEVEGLLARKTVLHYIEVVSGTEFAVNVNLPRLFKLDCDHITFYVAVDGKKICGKPCHSSKLRDTPFNLTVSGMKVSLSNGTTGLQKFCFASIKTGMVHPRSCSYTDRMI